MYGLVWSYSTNLWESAPRGEASARSLRVEPPARDIRDKDSIIEKIDAHPDTLLEYAILLIASVLLSRGFLIVI